MIPGINSINIMKVLSKKQKQNQTSNGKLYLFSFLLPILNHKCQQFRFGRYENLIEITNKINRKIKLDTKITEWKNKTNILSSNEQSQTTNTVVKNDKCGYLKIKLYVCKNIL